MRICRRIGREGRSVSQDSELIIVHLYTLAHGRGTGVKQKHPLQIKSILTVIILARAEIRTARNPIRQPKATKDGIGSL